MSRKLRFVPQGGSLVEVTCRTIQGRLLMRPSPLLNEIILGVLGRAQRRYPLEIVGYVFASNHYHLLLRVDQAERLSEFMGYFGGNLAREIARLTGWEDKVWSRRYESILITDEERAQVERLTYILSNTVKENLVARVEDWPGVHCARPLLTGEEVEGTWFDRRREYSARLQGKEPEPREFASPERVVLSQLPCWKHLSP
ncbi:MAG TPA: transposase, partial [Rubrobacter sp.]|nr:transposase [Rubrobacter sp.]